MDNIKIRSGSKNKKTMINISTGYLKQFVTLIFAFATRTIFIRTLGAEYAGVSGLFTNILTILSLAELGVGNVLVFSLYAPLKNNDTEELKKLILYYKKIYRMIALSVLLLGLSVIPFMDLFVKSELNHNEIVIYYLLYLLNSVVSYLVIYKSTLVQADQNLYVTNIVNTIFSLIRYTSQIVYLLITKDFLGYLVIHITCTMSANISMNFIANKMYPFLKEKENKETKIEVKQINNNIKSTFIYKISLVLINNTDNILISILLGTVYVGYYSNYYMLVNYLSTFIALTISGITASLGHLNAEGNMKNSYRMFRNLTYLFNLIALTYVVMMANVVQDFIPIWLGPGYLLDSVTVMAILFSFYVNISITSVWMYRESMGLFFQIRYMVLLTAILNIIFSIVLGKLFGMAGIIGATGLARICTLVWYEPKILFRKLKIPVSKYFIQQGKYLIVNIITLLISLLLCQFISGGWLQIIEKLMISTCIIIAIQFLVFRKTNEFKFFISKVVIAINGLLRISKLKR